MLGSGCDLKMSEIWGIPFPTNRGAKNHFFHDSQLHGNLVHDLYLRNEMWYA